MCFPATIGRALEAILAQMQTIVQFQFSGTRFLVSSITLFTLLGKE